MAAPARPPGGVTAPAAASADALGVGRRPEWLLLVATLALLCFYYGVRADAIGVFAPSRGWFILTGPPLPAGAHFAISGFLLGVVPVLVARACYGLRPGELGLSAGNWRDGLKWLMAGLPLAVLAGRIGADPVAIRAVYPLDPLVTAEPGVFLRHALGQAPYFLAWEVLFRGVLLFGLRRRLGAGPANLLQTALSVTAHFGRPLTEAAAAVPAGLLFGWIDLRVGSVWYVAVVHWTIGASLDYFILAAR